jgi:hypothetical protein
VLLVVHLQNKNEKVIKNKEKLPNLMGPTHFYLIINFCSAGAENLFLKLV